MIKSRSLAFKLSFYTALCVAILPVGMGFWCKCFGWEFSILAALLLWTVLYFLLRYGVYNTVNKTIRQVYSYVIVPEGETTKTDLKSIRDISRETIRFIKVKRREVEALKTRDAFRQEFIGNLSHEIKTPLFTLQGYIETLIDGNVSDKALYAKYLKRASKGANRLAHIVNDLDMITKLELGEFKLKLVDFDIVDLFRNIFSMLEMKTVEKQTTLSFDRSYQPIKVTADKDRISQVVENLIVNSIKYGKNKGTTEVSFEDVAPGKVEVRVSDNGDGIEGKYLDRIFERFFRTEQSRDRDEGGSGLGLSIVKHILESHEEKITVSSVFGVGSEFSFTLQKANPSQMIRKSFNPLLG